MYPEEAARHEAFAALLTSLQAKRREKYGDGRALHRKGLLALPARLSVHADLPDYCRYGLFAKPGDYDAHVRLSNGGMDIQSNRKPDIRGFAISVLGLSGPGALGGETNRQDFLLINQDSFSSPTSEEFMMLVEPASRGQAAACAAWPACLRGRFRALPESDSTPWRRSLAAPMPSASCSTPWRPRRAARLTRSSKCARC